MSDASVVTKRLNLVRTVNERLAELMEFSNLHRPTMDHPWSNREQMEHRNLLKSWSEAVRERSKTGFGPEFQTDHCPVTALRSAA